MPNRDNIINPAMVSVINLDSSVTDSDLYDLFITAGEVIWSEISTHRSSGLSLGYAYVSYAHAQHAARAIAELNLTVLKGKAIHVGSSTFSFNELIVGLDYEPSANEDDLRIPFEEFGPVTHTNIYMRKDHEFYMFISFENHQAAARAATALIKKQVPDMYYSGKGLVDPHVPFPVRWHKRDEEVETFEGINVRINNLDSSVSDHYLKKLFSPYGTISSCKATSHSNYEDSGYGRISFSTMEEAEKAIAAMNGKYILRYPIQVTLEEEDGGKRASSQMPPDDKLEDHHAHKKARVDEAKESFNR